MAEWSTITALPNSLDAYSLSLAAMADFVRKDYVSLPIRQLAEKILTDAGVDGHDSRGEAAALLKWVQQSYTYRKDPYRVEYVRDAPRALQSLNLDCDDSSVLLATLGASIGLLPRFYAPSSDGREPSHASVEFYLDGEWISADTTKQDAPLGWRVKGAKFDYVYPIFEGGDEMMGSIVPSQIASPNIGPLLIAGFLFWLIFRN